MKMNREIKFRAWSGSAIIMGHPQMMIDSGDGEIYNGITDDYPNWSLMQFTGLKDKNGKEIYEGDIVKTNYGKIGEVVYHDERASFIVHDPDHFNVQLFNELPIIEVIGNIYENPDLMK